MRIACTLIAFLFLAGCATRTWVPLRGQGEAQFRADVRGCQGWGGDVLVAPLILMPILYPLWVEATRQCLEGRGYAEVWKPETPVPARPDLVTP